MADDGEGGLAVRKPARRSPTTGHRRKRQPSEEKKRSLSSPREKEKLTSSDEELIDKCHEIIEEAKQIRRRSKGKVEVPNTKSEDEEPLIPEPEAEPQSKVKWLQSLFKKKVQDQPPKNDVITKIEQPKVPQVPREPFKWSEFRRDVKLEYVRFKIEFKHEVLRLKRLRNRCISDLLIVFIYCGLGAFVFKFTEGTFESFYKCGVKRVKRDFIDDLWRGSHHLREDEWKSRARRKLMEFENQLQDAFEAGINSYSGRRSWSFINALLYSLTVLTTIGLQLSPQLILL